MFASIGLLFAIPTAGHAVLRKRDPRSATLWVAICFLLPVLGPIAYLLFGINRTQRVARRRMNKRRRHRPQGQTRRSAGVPPTGRLPVPIAHLESLVRMGDRFLDESLVSGNTVRPLINGDKAYPAMLEAIARAERTVTLCSYIFDYDSVGQQFVDALAAAAKRGVEVKLLIDEIGSYWQIASVRRHLKKHGLRAAAFAPLGILPSRLMHMNLRNHRKMLVVDGKVGFAGGMNISARHLVKQHDIGSCVKDVHFSLRGPIVGQIQSAFADDWLFATGETLSGDGYFPGLERIGDSLARGIADGPDAPMRKLTWTVIGACLAARTSIRIQTPYFIPDAALRTALIAAALRGVAITIVLPLRSDVRIVDWATSAYLWEFLENGVRIFRHGPPFDHSKLMVVDDGWTLLGSGNLDPRSLRLHFEFDIEVYDTHLATVLARHIDAIAAHGHTETLAGADGRSLPCRLRDGVAKLFSPYL